MTSRRSFLTLLGVAAPALVLAPKLVYEPARFLGAPALDDTSLLALTRAIEQRMTERLAADIWGQGLLPMNRVGWQGTERPGTKQCYVTASLLPETEFDVCDRYVEPVADVLANYVALHSFAHLERPQRAEGLVEQVFGDVLRGTRVWCPTTDEATLRWDLIGVFKLGQGITSGARC